MQPSELVYHAGAPVSRPQFIETVWTESIVPIFIERFLIVVCAAAFYGLVITNSMNFDGIQRLGLGCALVGAALFLGATAYKQTHKIVGVPAAASPSPAINQSATDSTCSNAKAGKDVAINCSPPKENKDAPKPSPNP